MATPVMWITGRVVQCNRSSHHSTAQRVLSLLGDFPTELKHLVNLEPQPTLVLVRLLFQVGLDAQQSVVARQTFHVSVCTSHTAITGS